MITCERGHFVQVQVGDRVPETCPVCRTNEETAGYLEDILTEMNEEGSHSPELVRAIKALRGDPGSAGQSTVDLKGKMV